MKALCERRKMEEEEEEDGRESRVVVSSRALPSTELERRERWKKKSKN